MKKINIKFLIIIFYFFSMYTSSGNDENSYFLQADEIIQDQNSNLIIAQGKVQIVKGAYILKANRIEFNTAKNSVLATGNVTILEKDGSVIFAEKANLSNDLREGVIKAIGVLLSNKARIASQNAQITKDGSEINYKNVVFTSCITCSEEKRLLWKIKARSAKHIKSRKVIFYKHVTLEAFGIPVAYSPFFYHPDPTVKRKTGLLQPRFGSSTIFGNTYKQPIYVALSDKTDLTLNPKVSTKEGLILDGTYRTLGKFGETLFSGSITRGSKVRVNEPNKNVIRGHVDLRSTHRITQNWTLGSDISRSSDPSYLARYGFGRGGNVLTQNLFAERRSKGKKLDINLYKFQSLSDETETQKIPFIAPNINYKWTNIYDYNKTFLSAIIDGNFLTRKNNTSTKRIASTFVIEKPYISRMGYEIINKSMTRIGIYNSDLSEELNKSYDNIRFTQIISSQMKYPLVKKWRNDSGKIEPIIQLVVSPTNTEKSTIPNDDSLDLELSKDNLYSLNRFPGYDKIEGGFRANYGVNFTLNNPKGAKISSSIGRVYRSYKQTLFDITTGFPEKSSDIVGDIKYKSSSEFDMLYHYRVSKTFEPRSSRLIFNAKKKETVISLGYVQLRDFPSSNNANTEQIQLSTRQKIKNNWSFNFNQNRNLAGAKFSQPLTSSWILEYVDECSNISIYVTKDNTSDLDIPSTTSAGFTIKLFGF